MPFNRSRPVLLVLGILLVLNLGLVILRKIRTREATAVTPAAPSLAVPPSASSGPLASSGTPSAEPQETLVRLRTTDEKSEFLPSEWRTVAYGGRFSTPGVRRASEVYRKRQFARAASLFKAELATNPGNLQARGLLALSLCRMGRWKEAERECRECLRRDPRAVENHLHLGFVLLGQGDQEGAEEAYRAAVALEEDNLVAHHSLARIALLQERDADAESELKILLRLQPSFTWARYALGTLYLDQGRISLAKRVFQEVTLSDPDYPLGHHLLAMALLEEGDLTGAETELRAALAVPFASFADKAKQYYLLGIVHERRGDAAGALTNFTMAVDTQRRSGERAAEWEADALAQIAALSSGSPSSDRK